MLHRITVENFFSIADKQELNFRVPANAPESPVFRLSRESGAKSRIPTVIAFFGANASGKSTALRVVASTVSFILHGFNLPPESPIPSIQPYMNKSWWNKPTKILIEFDGAMSENLPLSLYRYEIHISHSIEKFGKAVVYEALSYSPNGKFRRIFERNEQRFSFGKEFDITDKDPRTTSIRPNASVLSTLAQFNHKISNDFLRGVNALQTNIIGVDKYPLPISQLLPFYKENPSFLVRLNHELRRIDLGLEEMTIELGVGGTLFARFKHTGLDADIVMGQESSGTRRFIEIFPRLQFALDSGGLAVIDELDSDIHPTLLPELLRWFYDSERNKHGAQLLFTAHNPVILDELEKEQVFFAEKRLGKPTCLYGARDIKGLRREPNLRKKYLSGELGAIPHIG